MCPCGVEVVVLDSAELESQSRHGFSIFVRSVKVLFVEMIAMTWLVPSNPCPRRSSCRKTSRWVVLELSGPLPEQDFATTQFIPYCLQMFLWVVLCSVVQTRSIL